MVPSDFASSSCFFFFSSRRRHTRCSRDWSSDVCSSDLQLAVLQRRQPRRPHLTWADRALLAALLSVIPKARRQGLQLLVTPDTILRWHRSEERRVGKECRSRWSPYH